MSRRERVIDTRKCRNWQTSKTKDLVAAMSCGFKSHLPHYFLRKSLDFQGFFCIILCFSILLKFLQSLFYYSVFYYFLIPFFIIYCSISYRHRSFTTSPAMISPATDGTNATLPGISRRSVHLCSAPGGQIQFVLQLIAISSIGLVGCSSE